MTLQHDELMRKLDPQECACVRRCRTAACDRTTAGSDPLCSVCRRKAKIRWGKTDPREFLYAIGWRADRSKTHDIWRCGCDGHIHWMTLGKTHSDHRSLANWWAQLRRCQCPALNDHRPIKVTKPEESIVTKNCLPLRLTDKDRCALVNWINRESVAVPMTKEALCAALGIGYSTYARWHADLSQKCRGVAPPTFGFGSMPQIGKGKRASRADKVIACLQLIKYMQEHSTTLMAAAQRYDIERQTAARWLGAFGLSTQLVNTTGAKRSDGSVLHPDADKTRFLAEIHVLRCAGRTTEHAAEMLSGKGGSPRWQDFYRWRKKRKFHPTMDQLHDAAGSLIARKLITAAPEITPFSKPSNGAAKEPLTPLLDEPPKATPAAPDGTSPDDVTIAISKITSIEQLQVIRDAVDKQIDALREAQKSGILAGMQTLLEQAKALGLDAEALALEVLDK